MPALRQQANGKTGLPLSRNKIHVLDTNWNVPETIRPETVRGLCPMWVLSTSAVMMKQPGALLIRLPLKLRYSFHLLGRWRLGVPQLSLQNFTFAARSLF